MILCAVDPAIANVMIRIFILFVLMAIVLVMMNKRYDKGQKARSEALAAQYKTMTRALLDAAPDEDLADAVVANLNGKLDPKVPDPYYTIPLLSRERNLVYALWLCDHELNNGNFATMQNTGSFRFVDVAADACEQIGAEKCADALRDAFQNAADEEALADAHVGYMEARGEEQPMERLVAFIRDNAAAFLDEPDGETPAESDET